MASSQIEAPQGPLSLLAKPVFYKLDMIIDPNTKQFSGIASIDINLESDTNGIWLHGKDLKMSSVKLARRLSPKPFVNLLNKKVYP